MLPVCKAMTAGLEPAFQTSLTQTVPTSPQSSLRKGRGQSSRTLRPLFTPLSSKGMSAAHHIMCVLETILEERADNNSAKCVCQSGERRKKSFLAPPERLLRSPLFCRVEEDQAERQGFVFSTTPARQKLDVVNASFLLSDSMLKAVYLSGLVKVYSSLKIITIAAREDHASWTLSL